VPVLDRVRRSAESNLSSVVEDAISYKNPSKNDYPSLSKERKIALAVSLPIIVLLIASCIVWWVWSKKASEGTVNSWDDVLSHLESGAWTGSQGGRTTRTGSNVPILAMASGGLGGGINNRTESNSRRGSSHSIPDVPTLRPTQPDVCELSPPPLLFRHTVWTGPHQLAHLSEESIGDLAPKTPPHPLRHGIRSLSSIVSAESSPRDFVTAPQTPQRPQSRETRNSAQ
jgi:hypothetical protein